MKKTVVLSTAVTQETDAALKRLAELEDRPVGWLVRKAIEAFLIQAGVLKHNKGE